MYARLLRHSASGRPQRRADELLTFVQLSDRANSEVEPLSGGMKRRLTIARVVSSTTAGRSCSTSRPPGWIRSQARDLGSVVRLKQRGATLLLTTHYMEEAEQLCDRVVIMDRGRIIARRVTRAVSSAGPDPEVLELRVPPCRPHDGARDGERDRGRIEELPDRMQIYTSDAEGALTHPCGRCPSRQRAGATIDARRRPPSPDRPRAHRSEKSESTSASSNRISL